MLHYKQLLNGCENYIKNEPRDFIYKIATRIVSQSEDNPTKVSEGLAVLLLTWNMSFYKFGLLDIDQLEECLRKWYRELREYERRDIESLTTRDDVHIRRIFDDFKVALRREGKRPADAPVSAAKALHLLAPKFFPLWDDSIAKAREHECSGMKSEDYVRFMHKTRDLADEVLESYVEEHGGTRDEAVEAIWNLHPHKIPEKKGKLLKWIDEYNYARYTIPMRKISQKLKEYPTIKKSFGKQWLHDQILEKEKEGWHPLVHLLLEEKPDYVEIKRLTEQFKESENPFEQILLGLKIERMQYGYNILNHLEECLSDLSSERGFKKLIQNLKNAPEFWSYFPEAEVAARLKKSFEEIELEPRFPNAKNPDLKVKVGGRWVYFEIVTPRFARVLREAKEEAVEISPRASGILLREFDDHFRDAQDQGYFPPEAQIIIVVNTGLSELDETDFEDSLKGTTEFVVLVDKETREVVDEFWTRKPDEVSRVDVETRSISAVVTYKREMSGKSMKLTGKIQQNPLASNKLGKDMELIRRALFSLSS